MNFPKERAASFLIALVTCAAAVPAAAEPEPSLDAAESETRANSADDGLKWLAVPLAKYNPDAGVVWGARLLMKDMDPGYDPFQWSLKLKANYSFQGRHEHYLYLDIPRLFGSEFRLFTKLQFLQIDDANYFGVGNDSELRPIGTSTTFDLMEPRGLVHLRRYLGDYFVVGGINVGLTRTDYAANSVLAQNRPTGVDGGHSIAPIFAVGIDTRNDELRPRSGTYTELYTRGTFEPISSHGWSVVGADARGYFSIAPWLVFAQRGIVEHAMGDIPFYELNWMGGTQPVLAVGGEDSQRGYAENRFVGRGRAIANSELRAYSPPLWKQLFVGGGPFVAVSRILDDGPFFAGLHPSGGVEGVVGWGDVFMFRGDFALSPEGTGFYLTAEHLF